jgi:hypothetical protein
MTTTTATATPAQRLLETLSVEPGHAAAELTDSKTAMLSWAGRDGRYTLDDLEAILKGHGETLRAWVDDCDAHGFDAVYNAEALLTWLGY